MPPQPSVTQIRLNNITTCLTITANTLHVLASSLKTPFLEAISNTTQSLLEHIQTVRQNKNDCTELLEQTYQLLNAIMMVHIKSDTGGELPPSVLNHIGKFTETLHKIHTFVEAQQVGSKVKNFFRQGEMSRLLNECKAGLRQGFDIFEVDTLNIMNDITKMQEDVEKRHKEVLDMIEALSDRTSSDGASSISRVYSGSHNSSTSISMLPSEPKIFHGRESELSDLLCLFGQGSPRIAILGGGGMGKTSLARAVIHHSKIAGRYEQQRFFVACDSAATQVELAGLIGTHLGLKPGKDLTHPVIQHFTNSSHSLLILDNLETLWEPTESRANIEEFLSLLTGVEHLALVITMRGAERPAKVAWTRPFLQPLKPLEQDAARQTFIDIADNTHNAAEVDKLLSFTDNMPLAINLIAHLVDSEGCSNVLFRWEEEKTSLISDGYDKRSDLDLSISLSLSSPRLNSVPHSKDLLSLLSMLPDGLSDAELVQAKLPIDNILGCKAALIQTTLAYSDDHKRLKALVPIREYMQKIKPPAYHLVRPLLKHFKELLELFMEYYGTQSSSATVARITLNYSNIQNILWTGAQQGHPDIVNTIYCACDLISFSQLIGKRNIPFADHIPSILPQLHDHHLEAYYVLTLFNSFRYSPISNAETLVVEALEHSKHFDDPDLKCMVSDH
ncbi:P-loop containing nucleoside triphosphate hydrolase protein [Mycena leptocephala]|nr:P-loop containing nucleoside triphosphate hydrolase protein [Mycena leptocephala]